MKNAADVLKECPYCGLNHTGRCPQIRSIEYYPNGTIKKIEYENGQTPTQTDTRST